MEGIRRFIEYGALAVEILAVAVIQISVAFGTIRYLLHLGQQVGDAYERYKRQLGKALLLGLEFLVAADIVRTVALEQTVRSVIILAILVLVRTFLSWSVVVEIEGRWPWRAAADRSGREALERRE